MKIKKLSTILKKRKRAIIFERQSSNGIVFQYISDGSALYPIYGLPRLRKESLLTILDIPQEKWSDWHVSVKDGPEGMNLTDVDETESQAFPTFYSLQVGEKTMMPLETEYNGVLFLDRKYLNPISDAAGFSYFKRQDKAGNDYIAVKEGLLILAVIMPVRMVTPDFCERTREFQLRCTKEMVCGNMPKNILIDMDKLEQEEEQ